MGVGSKIVPSDINSVFSRLEALRVKHYNGAGQTSAGKNALSTAFTTNVVNSNEKAVEKYSLMKQYLNTLRNSTFLTSLTTSTIDTITTPQAGDLISFANLEVASSVVTEVESMPFTNGSNFSGFHSNCFNFDGTDFSCFSFHPNGTNFSGFNSSNFSPFCAKCFNPFCGCFSSFSGSPIIN